MNLKKWDATIKQIADEINSEGNDSGQQKVLFEWRAKLAKEPLSLPLFQIDAIVRAVRKMLIPASNYKRVA
jgi:hypothetical protein